jgi:hypothetical protein
MRRLDGHDWVALEQLLDKLFILFCLCVLQ